MQYRKKRKRNIKKRRERTFPCSITKKEKEKDKAERENFSLQYHSADDEKMPMMCYHLRSCVPKLVKRSHSGLKGSKPKKN